MGFLSIKKLDVPEVPKINPAHVPDVPVDAPRAPDAPKPPDAPANPDDLKALQKDRLPDDPAAELPPQKDVDELTTLKKETDEVVSEADIATKLGKSIDEVKSFTKKAVDFIKDKCPKYPKACLAGVATAAAILALTYTMIKYGVGPEDAAKILWGNVKDAANTIATAAAAAAKEAADAAEAAAAAAAKALTDKVILAAKVIGGIVLSALILYIIYAIATSGGGKKNV